MIVNTPQQTFRAALGQFFVKETSTENLAAARSLIERSETAGADLLVLPECIIARKLGMPDWGQKHAEPLDGPFVSGPRVASRSPLTKGPSSGSACFCPQSGMPSFLAMMHSGSTSRSAPAVSERSISDRAAARFSVLVSFTKNCPSAARNVCCGVLTINLLFSLGLPSAAKICLQRHAPKSYPSKRTQIFSIQQHSIDPKQTPSLLRSIINRQHP